MNDEKDDMIFLLKEVNYLLMGLMINHPYYESRRIRDLNSKVCSTLKALKETSRKDTE